MVDGLCFANKSSSAIRLVRAAHRGAMRWATFVRAANWDASFAGGDAPGFYMAAFQAYESIVFPSVGGARGGRLVARCR